MAENRKQRSDSISGQIKAHQDAQVVMPVPDGVKFNTDEEMVLWRQFTAARAPDMWREFDLLLIAKMVFLEAKIRKHNDMIDRTGPLIENKRGTMIENPLLRVVDTLERRQLAIVRTMSLGVSSNTAADMNRSGRMASDAEDIAKLKKGDVVSLLAI